MEIEEAMGYIEFLVKEKEDEMLFQRWIAGAQYQMSFENFKNKLMPVAVIGEKKILKDVYEIIEMLGGGEIGDI